MTETKPAPKKREYFNVKDKNADLIAVLNEVIENAKNVPIEEIRNGKLSDEIIRHMYIGVMILGTTWLCSKDKIKQMRAADFFLTKLADPKIFKIIESLKSETKNSDVPLEKAEFGK